MTMTPQPAGEWRWLGPRALQFRPAEAWKPLARMSVKLGAAETRLVALLPTPRFDAPGGRRRSAARTDADRPHLFRAGRSRGALAPAVDRTASLARHVAAGRPDSSPSDYDIRPLERGERADEQSLRHSLSRKRSRDGRVAILRLRLSDEPGLDDETYELRVRTAPPFAVTEASCGRGWNDDKLDGVLRCAVAMSRRAAA